MKAHRGALAIVVGVGLALVAPVAVTANTRLTGNVFLASSAEYDESTGEAHAQIVEAFAPAGGPTQIMFGRYDDQPITCPDGWEGLVLTSVDGIGEGSLTMGRDLRSSRLTGVLDLQTTVIDLCDGGGITVSEATDVAIEGTVTGVGQRIAESQAQAQRLLPGANLHWRGRLILRQGTGSFELGGEPFQIDGSLYGRVTEVAHVSLHRPVQGELAMAAMSAAVAGAGGLQGSGVFAQAIAVREMGDTYGETFVGAIQATRGETLVELHEYAEREVTCPDGWSGWDGVYRDGWASGRLEVKPRYLSATFEATMDVMTTTIDGCTGEETWTIDEGIVVRGTLIGSGPLSQASSFLTIRLGKGQTIRERIREVARAAVATVTIGDRSFEGLDGAIGRQSWHFR